MYASVTHPDTDIDWTYVREHSCYAHDGRVRLHLGGSLYLGMTMAERDTLIDILVNLRAERVGE